MKPKSEKEKRHASTVQKRLRRNRDLLTVREGDSIDVTLRKLGHINKFISECKSKIDSIVRIGPDIG